MYACIPMMNISGFSGYIFYPVNTMCRSALRTTFLLQPTVTIKN